MTITHCPPGTTGNAILDGLLSALDTIADAKGWPPALYEQWARRCIVYARRYKTLGAALEHLRDVARSAERGGLFVTDEQIAAEVLSIEGAYYAPEYGLSDTPDPVAVAVTGQIEHAVTDAREPIDQVVALGTLRELGAMLTERPGLWPEPQRTALLEDIRAMLAPEAPGRHAMWHFDHVWPAPRHSTVARWRVGEHEDTPALQALERALGWHDDAIAWQPAAPEPLATNVTVDPLAVEYQRDPAWASVVAAILRGLGA